MQNIAVVGCIGLQLVESQQQTVTKQITLEYDAVYFFTSLSDVSEECIISL
jgi:hypothetical protein